jgi:TolB-like protein
MVILIKMVKQLVFLQKRSNIFGMYQNWRMMNKMLNKHGYHLCWSLRIRFLLRITSMADGLFVCFSRGPVLGFLLFFWVIFPAFPKNTDQALTLDQAITDAANTLTEQMSEGSVIAILGFRSDSPDLTDYVIEELISRIAVARNLSVVDRQEMGLELLGRELNFQLSGEVSDKTAQAIGKKFGAQFVVSGSFTPLGDRYRIRFRAVHVETARIEAVYTGTVLIDSPLRTLLRMQIPDFSAGRRTAAMLLNPLAGLGSFTMGDWLGGVLVLAGYGIGTGLIVWDMTGFTYDDEFAGIPGTIGFGVAGAAAVFGLIRPWFFHRPEASGALAGFRVSLAVNGIDKKIPVLYTGWSFNF